MTTPQPKRLYGANIPSDADFARQEAERAAAIRFTCRRCGEHRDSTRRGHCDDCEG